MIGLTDTEIPRLQLCLRAVHRRFKGDWRSSFVREARALFCAVVAVTGLSAVVSSAWAEVEDIGQDEEVSTPNPSGFSGTIISSLLANIYLTLLDQNQSLTGAEENDYNPYQEILDKSRDTARIYDYRLDNSANIVYFDGVPVPSAVWGVVNNGDVDLERMYGDPSLAQTDGRASFLIGGERNDLVLLIQTPNDTPTISALSPLTSQAADCGNRPSEAMLPAVVLSITPLRGLCDRRVDRTGRGRSTVSETVSSSTSQTAEATLSDDSPVFGGPIRSSPSPFVVLPNSAMLQSLLSELCANFFGYCANFVPPPTISEFGSTRGIGAVPLPISVAAPSPISVAAPWPISVAAPWPISVAAPSSPVLVSAPLPVYVPAPGAGSVPEMSPLGMMFIGFGGIALALRRRRPRVPRFLANSALGDS